jgi:hypothetical protein
MVAEEGSGRTAKHFPKRKNTPGSLVSTKLPGKIDN